MARMMDGGVRVRGLEKTLRGKHVLRGVDLDVGPGEFAVIEGANGAGKTTLIRVLATLVRPDLGTAIVDGHDVTASGALVRRSIGIVLVNERSLYWRLDAVENLRAFGRLRGMTMREIRMRTTDLLDQLDLAEKAHERVSRLSTGQRQRLLIARALLEPAAVLLLDEPLRGLDEPGMTTVLEILAGRARAGATVLVSAPLVGDIVPYAHAHHVFVDGRLEHGEHAGTRG